MVLGPVLGLESWVLVDITVRNPLIRSSHLICSHSPIILINTLMYAESYMGGGVSSKTCQFNLLTIQLTAGFIYHPTRIVAYRYYPIFLHTCSVLLSGVAMNHIGSQFWKKKSVKGRFSKKTQKKSIFFNVLRLQAAITPQWLWIDGNFVTKLFLYECVVSIFTLGINSESFPWPVNSIQETSFKFSAMSEASWGHTAHNADAGSDDRLLSLVTYPSWQKIEM